MRELAAGIASAHCASATASYTRDFEPLLTACDEVSKAAPAMRRTSGAEVDADCARVGFSKDFAQFLKTGRAASASSATAPKDTLGNPRRAGPAPRAPTYQTNDGLVSCPLRRGRRATRGAHAPRPCRRLHQAQALGSVRRSVRVLHRCPHPGPHRSARTGLGPADGRQHQGAPVTHAAAGWAASPADGRWSPVPALALARTKPDRNAGAGGGRQPTAARRTATDLGFNIIYIMRTIGPGRGDGSHLDRRHCPHDPRSH